MNDSRNPVPVGFWFDPLCPWTWLTSRWLREVEGLRPVTVTWHVMSLAILNEDHLDELPESRQALMQESWAPLRVLIAAADTHGTAVLEPLYTALGSRYHLRRQPRTRQVLEAALRDTGLPEGLAGAGDTDDHDKALRASHREGMDLVGGDVGSPVIAVPGPGGGGRVGFFGPVVTPAPKGESAARLWDGIVEVAAVPGFYELKRARTSRPDFR